MTRTTNARLAGFTFLFYIATGITSLILFGQATGGAEGSANIATKLASIAQHQTLVRLTVLLTLLTFVCAVVLGVTLYALTRDEDRDLAMLGLCFRVTEGVNAVAGAGRTLQLLAIAAMATGSTAVTAPDAAAAQAYGGLMLNQGGWTGNIGALCFVMASTLYS